MFPPIMEAEVLDTMGELISVCAGELMVLLFGRLLLELSCSLEQTEVLENWFESTTEMDYRLIMRTTVSFWFHLAIMSRRAK